MYIYDVYTNMYDITDFFTPSRILPKIANKAEDVPKKVTVNNIIKTVDTSKNFIKDFQKVIKNDSDK